MIRLALIGCGRHCRRFHAPALAKYAAEHPGEIELAATCDLDIAAAEQMAADFGFVRTYDDVEKLLAAETIDACWAVMPHTAIAEMGVMLLQRGMPCVIEKPLGRTLDEADRLAEAAAASETPHMISLNRRFSPYMTQALTWAAEQGPILYVHGRMVRHARREPPFIRGACLHGIDAMVFIGGDVDEYSTQTLTAPAVTGQWYTIDFDFGASGAVGRLDLLATAGMREEVYDIYGEDFRCRVSIPIHGSEASVRCWRGNKLAIEDVAGSDEPEFITDGAYAEAEHFIQCLRDGAPLGPTVQNVWPATEISFAIAAELGPEGAVDPEQGGL